MKCSGLLPSFLVTLIFLSGCKKEEEKRPITSKAPQIQVGKFKKKSSQQEAQNPKQDNLSLEEATHYFASVAAYTVENYVEPIDYKTLLEGALEGMLSQLDPHSSFLEKREFSDLKNETEGHYAGLGLEVSMEEDSIHVISPIDESPAARAGIKTGDRIVRIDKVPVQAMSLSQANELLKGEPKTTVEITVRRAGEKDFPVKLRREIIKPATVKSKVFKNILYLHVRSFDATTTSSVLARIQEAKQRYGDKVQGLLLDLRNNAGGLFNEAASLANLFLNEGTIVSIKTRQGNEEKHIKAEKNEADQITGGLTIAVLINAGTASSSEIFAGALQDHNRAIILGTPSFGKGSVQSVVPLKNGSAIKLTTALYYTPQGASIQKHGIIPDIYIHQAKNIELLDEDEFLREADFKTALSSGRESTIEHSKEPEEVNDYQLAQALDVLRGMIYASINKIEPVAAAE